MAIETRRIDEIALVTINRPEALNALSFSLIAELGAAIEAVGRSDARALIITGAGAKAFCAGADIKELMDRPMQSQYDGAVFGQTTFAALERLRMPSIALINGYAFGGGLELAMACTFRMATENARLGLPEVRLGLIPGYGGTQRLARLIGESRALEMILTARTVTAQEAVTSGLVNRLAGAAALDDAVAFAREFTGFSLPVLALARAAVTRGLGMPVQEGLRLEADLSTLAFQTQDAAEGMAAFAAKRKPTFKDC